MKASLFLRVVFRIFACVGYSVRTPVAHFCIESGVLLHGFQNEKGTQFYKNHLGCFRAPQAKDTSEFSIEKKSGI